MTHVPIEPYARLTDLKAHPVSVHPSPSWAALGQPGVWISTLDKGGKDYRPALLGIEEARVVRDALTRFLVENDVPPPA